jgi:threonine aldolase
MKYQFASDNTAGVCPEIWKTLQEANEDYAASYGNDRYTQQAADMFRELFEKDCDVYFVFNGTAANSLSLAAMCQSYHSVVTQEGAHIETDECGAPEFFSNGTKILTTQGVNGKLNLDEVEKVITKRTDIHYPKPRVISFSQSTEAGTVYTVDEVRRVCDLARKYKMHVHMDGARFANAVASLNVKPADVTWRAGVDVLCFGGTKQGLPISEAVVFFNRELSKEFDYRCKQSGQLASKMRFLSAGWIPMLKDGLWLKYGKKANDAAKSLGEKVKGFSGLKLLYPVEANGVFLEMPAAYHSALKELGWGFYTFIGNGARFMCSWKTTEKDVEELVSDLKKVASKK